MVYQAARRIKGPLGWIEAGEVIPADQIQNQKLWPAVPLRACVSLGLIREIEVQPHAPTAPIGERKPSQAAVDLIHGCQRCDKAFKTKGGLSLHMRSHR